MPELTFDHLRIDSLLPNPWNPNAMDDEMYAKAIESIHEFGFIDPITVRDLRPEALIYEIIDGEHRWRAAHDHGHCERGDNGKWVSHFGLEYVPVVNLGRIPDTAAQQMTIVLNETRGQYDPKKMGQLLTDILTVEPLPKLTELLPFTKGQIEELAELPKVDWDQVSGPPAHRPREEKMVELVYRLPTEEAAKITEAITAWRDREGEAAAPDWRALSTIAEEWLEHEE